MKHTNHSNTETMIVYIDWKNQQHANILDNAAMNHSTE